VSSKLSYKSRHNCEFTKERDNYAPMLMQALSFTKTAHKH